MAKYINLDTDQAAAYRADENVAVSAGAGSGKTTVLAERYVRLVTEGGLNINEVLTLTFTRKASAEMYARIVKRLTESPDPRGQERLTQFDTARISTLDSFCTAITKGASYRYGISGDFRVDETELWRTAAETAVETVMHHRRDAAVCRLVAARSFEAIIYTLFADAAMTVFSFVRPGEYAVQAGKQIRFITQELERCCSGINETGQKILDLIGKRKGDALEKAQIAVRSRLPVKSADTFTALIETAEYFMSSDSFALPKAGKDAVLLEFREAATVLKKELAPQLFSLAQTLRFQDDMLSIGTLLDEYERLFLERKRTKGLVSFRDTAELAVDILTKDAELRRYYKNQIKAVMIDEFQDNNELQKNLLYLIAERDDAGLPGALPKTEDLTPNKLFFVGDEKQSIYRFRGADVSVFRGLAQELGREGQGSLSLSTNYRSAPELVAFFNALFPGVFGVPEAPFEAEFAPMRPSPYKQEAVGKKPPVEVFVQETQRAVQSEPDDEGETAKETGEALTAAKRIIAGVEQGEFGFGDVAVLFRSTTHQNDYERTFRQAGIPFSAADPRGLFAEAPANDFYGILRLSLFPSDSNAYATVLRSPFVRLGDESVFRILLEKPHEPFPEDPPASWFPNQAEQHRYLQGQAVFSGLKERIDLQGIAPVLAYLWYETGYRTYLLYDESSRPNLEHFEYLYALALEADERRLTLSAFLDELAPRMGTADKTETGDIPELTDQVLFITVHKSKGLEFPVVILANAGAAGKSSRNDKPYFLDPEFGLVLNLKSDTAKRNEKSINYFYDLRKEYETRQEEAELKRLFYVAATRAKERLIILGSRNVSKAEAEGVIDLEPQERIESLIKAGRFNSEGVLQKKSFLDLFSCGVLGAAEDIPGYRLIPRTPPSLEEYTQEIRALRERVTALKGLRSAQALPEAFYAASPILPPPDRIIRAVPSQLAVDTVSAGHERLPALKSDPLLETPGEKKNTDEDLHTNFGTLCHRMIEILFIGDTPPERLLETARQEAQSRFKTFSEGALKTVSQEALALAQAFLDTPYGREAVTASRRQTEFPFTLPLKPPGQTAPVLIHGKMDLIYEHQGRCVIIDFKTDRILDAESHRVQLACYRCGAKAFSDFPAETVLIYLRNMQALPVDAALSSAELYERARQTRA